MWRDDLTCFLKNTLVNANPQLATIVGDFLGSFGSVKCPMFYLMVKTHKSLEVKNGHWPSRPITGLTNWCTTPPSTLLAIIGEMFLRLDAICDPLQCSLRDSRDLVARLEELPRIWNFNDGPPRISSFDFNSLYTNFTWGDIASAYTFWRAHWLQHHHSSRCTSLEKEFAEWLLNPIAPGDWAYLQYSFPYLKMDYHASLTLGEALLRVVFTHNIFQAPGAGVYRQAQGWSMGTNCAPAWANLILRSFILQSPAFLAGPALMWRFLDDGLLIHPQSATSDLVQKLQQTFPAHLPFECLVLGGTGDVQFLDLRIVRLSPPTYCTFFKSTNTASYIPWGSNTPRHTKLGWVKTELVRYLRTNSHPHFFYACVRRLHLATARLHYPKRVLNPLPVDWGDRDKYLHRQGTQGGLEGRVHVFRVPFDSCIPVKWSRLMKKLQRNVNSVLPGVRMFCSFKSQANSRRVFHRNLMQTLSKIESPELQNLKQNLSQDADDFLSALNFE